MFCRLGRIGAVAALCCALGLHWMALQSLAWTTMVVKFARHAPLREAIAHTFDGAHPCSLCHAVNEAGNSEKKSNLQSPEKIDIICTTRAVSLLPRSAPFAYPVPDFPSFERRPSPPVPPPRLEPV